MVDVFEEVEEELRADRWRALAKKYGPYAAAGLGAIVLIVAGVWGFEAWSQAATAKASAAYDQGMQALERGDPVAADTLFETASKSGSRAYKALALMQRAGIAVGKDDTDKAVEYLDAAAKAAPGEMLADAARFKAALALMDTAPYADLEKRLTPLTEEGRAYRSLAREALAMAKLAAGKTQEARGDFVVLTLGQDVPDGVRTRAQAAIQLIDAGSAQRLPAVAKAARELPRPAQAPAGANPFAPQAGAE